MSQYSLRNFFFISLALFIIPGCSKKDSTSVEKPVEHQALTVKKKTTVFVPDTVKDKWKSVKIAITDKRVNKDKVYNIPINGEVSIPNSKLSIKAENFLPDFLMNGTTMTSKSNKPKNPAAHVLIMENGKEIFKGWLFMLYPNTHTFQHPKYGFKLVDFVSAT